MSTLGSKLESGEYASRDDFLRDFRLIISNAILYNGANSGVGKKAVQLETSFNKAWHKMEATIGRALGLAPPPPPTSVLSEFAVPRAPVAGPSSFPPLKVKLSARPSASPISASPAPEQPPQPPLVSSFRQPGEPSAGKIKIKRVKLTEPGVETASPVEPAPASVVAPELETPRPIEPAYVPHSVYVPPPVEPEPAFVAPPAPPVVVKREPVDDGDDAYDPAIDEGLPPTIIIRGNRADAPPLPSLPNPDHPIDMGRARTILAKIVALPESYWFREQVDPSLFPACVVPPADLR